MVYQFFLINMLISCFTCSNIISCNILSDDIGSFRRDIFEKNSFIVKRKNHVLRTPSHVIQHLFQNQKRRA